MFSLGKCTQDLQVKILEMLLSPTWLPLLEAGQDCTLLRAYWCQEEKVERFFSP